VTDSPVVAALRAGDPESLLPSRDQARASSLSGHVDVVDVLHLGEHAGAEWFVAVVTVGERLIVVPGRLADGRFTRDPAAAGRLVAGRHGSFDVSLYAGGIPDGDALPIGVDQTNDSVVIGEVMVKWQIDAEVSPAPARLRALEGADLAPPLKAIVTWQGTDGVERLVLTAAQALPGADDGWTWAVDLVCSLAQGDDVDALAPVRRIGVMTAQMHVRLAHLGTATWGADAMRVLHADCIARFDDAVRLIDGPEGERLQARAAAMRDRLDTLLAIDQSPVMATHGDLHIGQVLRHQAPGTGERMAIVDFDGSPVLAAADRLALQPAARDVAGMLASLDHVARVVVHRTAGIDRLRAEDWISDAQRVFLDAYREALATHDRSDLLDERLLPALLVDQECREYVYAAGFLPHWRYVPDAVITAMFPEEP